MSAVHRNGNHVDSLDIKLRDSDVSCNCTRSQFSKKYSDGKQYYKNTFPLMLSYAITAHKAQGATMSGPTVVHPGRVFCPGQMYVMLSRITDRRNLRIVGHLTPDQFIPVVF